MNPQSAIVLTGRCDGDFRVKKQSVKADRMTPANPVRSGCSRSVYVGLRARLRLTWPRPKWGEAMPSTSLTF
jgi:hypothetical protein